MPSLNRLKILALAFAAILSPLMGSAVGAKDGIEKPIPVDELQKGLMAALGDSFEFLGGEEGQAKERGAAVRFWFAKVRPKTAGEFAISYSTQFDFPPKELLFPPGPERGEYLIPFTVGECGAPRVILPRAWGGSCYPAVNVGDAVIIPIHIGRFESGHRFTNLNTEKWNVALYFSQKRYLLHDMIMERAAIKPMVRNDASDRLELLASWDDGALTVSGDEVHALTGYLEFKKPGEFNLAGRMDGTVEKNAYPGTSFRVVPQGIPVTVCLEQFNCKLYEGKSTYSATHHLEPGTLEARVGDRVWIRCGEYALPTRRGAAGLPSGVVDAQAFKSVAPYTPETKE